MNRQILLNKFMHEELHRYKAHYSSLSEQYPHLPEGSITKVDEGQYSRVLRQNGRQIKIALGANDNELLDDLRLRRQIKEALPLLKDKISIVDKFLAKDFIYNPLQLTLPEQYLDISPKLFLPKDVDPVEWTNARYRKGRFYAEDIKHYTEGGITTRSKSEAMIGTQLEHYDLPFRYEQAVKICGETIYPDFIIMHPVTRRLIYWEHLGINLVITYETLDDPLTIKAINAQIKEIMDMC